MAFPGEAQDGKSALFLIENSEPVVWLAGDVHLSQQTRTALEYLYSLAKEYATPCPLSHLLTINFDCEQIWQQIDLQSAPLLNTARRRLKHLQRIANSVELLDGPINPACASKAVQKGEEVEAIQYESEDVEDEEENTEIKDQGEEEEEEEDSSEGGPRGKSESEEDGEEHAVDDKFFRLKDMQRFLDEAEAPQDAVADNPHKRDAFEYDEDESEGEDEDMEVRSFGRMEFHGNLGWGPYRLGPDCKLNFISSKHNFISKTIGL
ncbi:hypothetical protein L7F22_064452 [Adiantum nelumboides]|nr:hypothetical protein [Adiantum nelumboides]